MSALIRSAIVVVALLILTSSAHGQVVRQITDARTGGTSVGDMDDAGSVVYAISSTDPLGTNPRHLFQIFRWDPDTGVPTQITDFAHGVVWDVYGPSVSDDGQTIVFVSTGNLTGANPDRSEELFVMSTDGTGPLQLTDSPSPMDGRIGTYVLSGDGNRVAWTSSFDHLGVSSGYTPFLFVIDTDGGGIGQLTTQDTRGVSISDDGERIVYSSGASVRGIEADGTNDRTIPAGVPATLSGDGSTLSFKGDPEVCSGPGSAIHTINWDGSGSQLAWQPYQGSNTCGGVSDSDITDDGQVVFFEAFTGRWEVFRVNRDGSGFVPLTDDDGIPGSDRLCAAPRASGSGNRLAFLCWGGEPFGGPNPDYSLEMFVMNGDGTGARQLSDGNEAECRDPEMTSDGAWIVFASDANLLDESPHPGTQIYHVAGDGSSLTRVTSFSEGDPRTPSITADGSTIVFVADDPSGAESESHVFAVQSDGTGLIRLTPDHPDSEAVSDPTIDGAGSVVVFSSNADLDGLNPALTWKIFRIQPDGTGLAVIAPPDPEDEIIRPRVDPTGTWVVYVRIIWGGGTGVDRVRIDGSNHAILAEDGGWPDISAGGEMIVFDSRGDLTGGNPDLNREIFRYDAPSGSLKQVTFTTQGDNRYAAISDDGQYAYFVSDSHHFETNLFYPVGVYRVHLSTFQVERVGALGCRPLEEDGAVAVNHDGSLAVFTAEQNCTEQNPDGLAELFLIDRNTPARISVSPGEAPTVVSWDHESGPVRYDVIRGDVANLGLTGETAVDLGDVLCLEDESTDADIVYYEDPDTPLAGQAFFYLYRGTHGVDAGPGTYGTGSTGGKRTPSSNDCPG